MTIKSVILLTFFLTSGLCVTAQTEYRYEQPALLNDGWKTADFRSLGFDSARVYQLFNQLSSGDHKLQSVVLVRNEHILLEEYFDEHDTHTQHDLRSVTKSVRSLLAGIAIDQGFIDSIDDPITKYLKTQIAEKNLSEQKQKITIKHLITMSSGLDCDDWNKKSKGQEDRVYRKKDWVQYTLDLPMVNEPGEHAAYCSMGTMLLAEIIRQSSGVSIDSFAEQYLFGPLGIENISWNHTSDKEVISSAKRLYMTPRDMAKLGQLVLNKGTWNGKQVVSEQWMTSSTTPITQITGIDYSFLWWNLPFLTHGKRTVSIAATGNGGQYILVFPEYDLVAVFTGSAYNSQEDKLPFAIVQDVLLPTFVQP